MIDQIGTFFESLENLPRYFVHLDQGLFLPLINEGQCVEFYYYQSVFSLVLDITFERCSIV